MTKIIPFLLGIIFCLAQIAGHAQVPTDTLVTSHDLIEQAIDLHNNGEYGAAIAKFALVTPCDPNYTWACYEMALSMYYNGNNKGAIAKCLEARDLKYDEPALYGFLGSLYDESGQTQKGVDIVLEALKKWPYNQNLLYNLGICYQNMGKPYEAEKAFINSLRINPYHASSNMGLAKVNFTLGRRAQSYLAYNMAMLLNPGRKYITEFEDVVSGEKDTLSHGYLYPEDKAGQAFQWDYLRYLAQSDLATKSDFNFPFPANYTIMRHSWLLISSLKFEPADTSFYSQFYVRFYSELATKNQYDAYSHYLLRNMEIDEVNKWIGSNQAKYDAFIEWAKTTINLLRGSGFWYENQLKQIVQYHYDDNGDLSAIGTEQTYPAQNRQGLFILINKEGCITEKGYYDNNQSNGRWLVLHPDGKIKQLLNFDHDVFSDTCFSYYENGVVSDIYPMSEGQKNGREYHYLPSGVLRSSFTYVNGILHGPAFYFDIANGFTQEYMNTNNLTEGLLIETWKTGAPKSEIHYQNDQYHGPYKSWYLNGKPKVDGNYYHGNVSGNYVEFYANGNKETEGIYDTIGKLTGNYTSYYLNGAVNFTDTGYTNGLLTGKRYNYFKDGRKRSRMEYDNNRIISIECYDKSGKILYQATEKDSAIYYKSFFTNDVLGYEGWYRNGEKDGPWKTYNAIGVLIGEENYMNGYLSGLQKNYYPSGAIKSEYACDSNNVIGLYKSYFPNGHLKQKGFYTKEGQTGDWTVYYTNDSVYLKEYYEKGNQVGREFTYGPDGKLTIIEAFNDNGQSTGAVYYNEKGEVAGDFTYQQGSNVFELKHPNGSTRRVIRVVDNRLSGVQEEYFPNGQLMSKVDYLYGFLNGDYTTYDYHGNKRYNANYLMRKTEGKETWYNNGQISTEYNSINGEYQGSAVINYYNGKPGRKMNFENDIRNDYTGYFAPDSQLMYRINFIDGTMTAYSYLDKNGKFIDDIPITPQTTEITAYYSNGKMSAKIPLKNGLYHGRMQTWYNTGTMLREVDFAGDETVGADVDYYPTGKVRESSQNANDELHGAYKLYYENGKLQKEGNYFRGNENGEWHVYNPDGSLAEILYYYNGYLNDIKKQ